MEEVREAAFKSNVSNYVEKKFFAVLSKRLFCKAISQISQSSKSVTHS